MAVDDIMFVCLVIAIGPLHVNASSIQWPDLHRNTPSLRIRKKYCKVYYLYREIFQVQYLTPITIKSKYIMTQSKE